MAYYIYVPTTMHVCVQDPEARIFVVAMYQLRALHLVCKVGQDHTMIILWPHSKANAKSI